MKMRMRMEMQTKNQNENENENENKKYHPQTYKSNSVSTRTVTDRLSGAAHHQNGALDGLHKKVGFSTFGVVGTQDSHLKIKKNKRREIKKGVRKKNQNRKRFLNGIKEK